MLWRKPQHFCDLYECLAGHGSRLLDTHELEDCRSNVSKLTVLHFLHSVASINHDERYIVERVCCVWSAVLVHCVVSVTVVSCDEDYITLCLSTQLSTAMTALRIASYTPVCPIMSPLAKLRMMRSFLPVLIASTSFSVTSGALISGWRS